MKLLFLDIDGVMNSDQSVKRAHQLRALKDPRIIETKMSFGCFAPWSVEALNMITDATGAAIVISSTWRGTALPFLRKWGVRGDFIDVTPYLDRYNGTIYLAPTRGQEIAKWFDLWATRPGAQLITDFVILDDDADMDPFMDHLVQTNGRERGLTEADALRAIEILNKSSNDTLTLSGNRGACVPC